MHQLLPDNVTPRGSRRCEQSSQCDDCAIDIDNHKNIPVDFSSEYLKVTCIALVAMFVLFVIAINELL